MLIYYILNKKIKTLFFIERKHFYIFFPVTVLSIILIVLSAYNEDIKRQIANNILPSHKIPNFSVSSYPFTYASNVLGESNYYTAENLNNSSNFVSAESFIVLDDDSKVVILSKNENIRFPMASTTKLMTALTALDYFKFDDVLTIKNSKVEGAVVGFKEGEKLIFEDLLYAMLLPSGNDAALAIAQNYPGGQEEFVKKMNVKVSEFNLYKTHFSDPTGLDDDGNYTTVVDLARLSSIAMKNQLIQKIVATRNKEIISVNLKQNYKLSNLNRLLGIDGVDGIKTGFTEEARDVLATSKIENGRRLIIVVMRSEDRFADTEKLLSFISGKITYRSIHP